MNNLTINLKTHVVITHNGSHYFIDNLKHEKIKGLGLDDMIEIDNSEIKGSAISEIMTIEKYYETYPIKEKSPELKTVEQIALEQGMGMEDFYKKSSKNGKEQMLIGLKRFCDNNPNALKAKMLYENLSGNNLIKSI